MSTAEVDACASADRVVLIVDDHHLVGVGLQTALRLNGFHAILSACTSADDIIEEAREAGADLVLLDLDLGSAGDGQALIGPLVGLGSPVLVLTGVSDRVRLAQCLEAGATAVASKNETITTVLDRVRRTADGDPVMSPAERTRYQIELDDHRRSEQLRIAPFLTLSPKERSVLAYIIDGLTAEDIASDTCVSLATVRSQIRAILHKLGLTSQLAAVAAARRSGWSNTECPG